MSEQILKSYDDNVDLFFRITKKSESLIRELLEGYGVSVHSVSSRTKARPSLVKKLSKQGRSYQELTDITDICGVRIVTYFEEDVDKVTGILEKEFLIDSKNSVDKRMAMDPDRFGYMSTHHVVRLSSNRSPLQEYHWFNDHCIEIQTRSILQHAWAEIEHDLGYKTKSEVPKSIRRRFSRLAGLLELADSEFNALRSALTEYNSEVADKIHTKPADIGIDRNSLTAFVKNSAIIADIDENIVKTAGWDLVDNDEGIAWYIGKLEQFGINSIGDLSAALEKNSSMIKEFAANWIGRDDDGIDDHTTHRGISIFYLIYVLLAQAGSEAEIIEYFDKNEIGLAPAQNLASELEEVYSKIHNAK